MFFIEYSYLFFHTKLYKKFFYIEDAIMMILSISIDSCNAPETLIMKKKTWKMGTIFISSVPYKF